MSWSSVELEPIAGSGPTLHAGYRSKEKRMRVLSGLSSGGGWSKKVAVLLDGPRKHGEVDLAVLVDSDDANDGGRCLVACEQQRARDDSARI